MSKILKDVFKYYNTKCFSGLDEQSGFQCISALKQLAKEGRTVICSIHAPSAKTFALFDHVYIISEGQCVYQGQGDQILSFLERIQLSCPVHYNPVDFLIDVASGEYGGYSQSLVTLTENGKLCYHCDQETENYDCNREEINDLFLEKIPEYYTSTISQLRVLLYRIFIQTYRNPTEIIVKTVMYAIMITVFSALYYNCGNDATKIFTNITYLFLSILALMYCALMPPLIHCPMEIKIIRSEYFNRWYNIPAYFLAKSLAVIPGYIVYTILYVVITYPLTDQPVAIDRMIKFIAICVLVNMIADACSMAFASVLSVVNAFFFGVSVMLPPVLFAVYGYGYPFHMHPIIVQLMLRTSFLRYALEALVDVVYGDRPQHLNCPDSEILCPLTSPKVITQVLGYGTTEYWLCVAALVSIYLISKCGHYFMLKQRLRPGKPAKMARWIVGRGYNLLVKYLR